VIEVSVREKDKVDGRQFMKLQGWAREAFRADRKKRQANANTWEKGWIGHDCDSEEIQEHGGMAEPRGGQFIVGPLQGTWSGEGRSNWPPGLVEPFAPEMRNPVAGSAAVFLVWSHAGRFQTAPGSFSDRIYGMEECDRGMPSSVILFIL